MVQRLQIPLTEDLAVYARLWQRFSRSQTKENLALVVLAERVLLERARNKKRRGRLIELDRQIRSIRSDSAYCHTVARMSSLSALSEQYPQYIQAGLLQEEN